MSDKLQKVLANAGFGSRREMETWIEQGRVSVNGKLATLGDRVENEDKVRVDGNLISHEQESVICRVLMYNKPEGELCSRKDPEGRPTVFDRLPTIKNGRWIAVGRLDLNTSGLLLFTNDGELANRLMHPKHEVEREYAVRVFGEVEPDHVKRLQKGVKLEDGVAKFTSIRKLPTDEESLNSWYHVTLSEGRNREVRRMWESQGLQVSRLIRVRYGALELQKRLPQGGWIELMLPDVNALRSSVQLPDEKETLIKLDPGKLDHVKLSRMRRSVKKHRVNQANKSRTGNVTKEKAPAEKPRSPKPVAKKPTESTRSDSTNSSRKPSNKKRSDKRPAGKQQIRSRQGQ
ncbi:MAG: 23S rRNA pseudouridine(2605) synthase RluB [Paraglaciecola sp.]|uniref:23S rRNA pseudouridine(2605) synthase RluB n=1 Tax=Paraglaciecola sp. TaxID=1920173 RepID=UPI00273DA01A|nr:23S rRNA pseudouridine(2605) synthase RluB [Paraglaciecola sp.]MDP5032543.1 23S rRNA pseudouridine(2605) synthase RluB [Paraglaciecola sp.]MDP5133769.1 23S rRNA pseudouridine(2605) synthase RluB [Paraglaciecola sp.]